MDPAVPLSLSCHKTFCPDPTDPTDPTEIQGRMPPEKNEALVFECGWQHREDGRFGHPHAFEDLGQEAQGLGETGGMWLYDIYMIYIYDIYI